MTRKIKRDREAAMLKASPAKVMAVNDVAPAERERIREHLKPVTEKHSKLIDPAVLAEFMSEVAKARAAK